MCVRLLGAMALQKVSRASLDSQQGAQQIL